MENVPDVVAHLMDRFTEHLEQYKSATYEEAGIRTDFIGPLFELFGRDAANEAGYAERYCKVVREDKISIEGGTSVPDYPADFPRVWSLQPSLNFEPATMSVGYETERSGVDTNQKSRRHKVGGKERHMSQDSENSKSKQEDRPCCPLDDAPTEPTC